MRLLARVAMTRGIKWSLRAFVSRRAVRLFLRAQTAVIKFVLRAKSTLENTYGEQREFRCANRNLSFVLKKETFFYAR